MWNFWRKFHTQSSIDSSMHNIWLFDIWKGKPIRNQPALIPCYKLCHYIWIMISIEINDKSVKWVNCVYQFLGKNLYNNIDKLTMKTLYVIQLAISTKVFAFVFFCFPYFIIQRNVLHTKYVIWLPTIRQFLDFLWRLFADSKFQDFLNIVMLWKIIFLM